MKSRWVYVLAALILVASGRVSAADRGRSAGHRQATTAPSTEVVPIVVIDPRNGVVAKIWSRSDGFTAKLAWARLRRSGWGPAHDLTFGLGIDRDPAVGMTSGGAWLFWRNERGEIFYAPLEIASGRLLGVPTALDISFGRLLGVAPLSNGGIRPEKTGGGPGMEGGVDTPIINKNCTSDDPNCEPTLPAPSPGTPGPYVPPVMNESSLVSFAREGGLDGPVTQGSNGGGLIVSSDPKCERQIVTLPQGDSLLVMEMDSAGRVTSRQVVSLESGVSAEEAGQTFLLASCMP